MEDGKQSTHQINTHKQVQDVQASRRKKNMDKLRCQNPVRGMTCLKHSQLQERRFLDRPRNQHINYGTNLRMLQMDANGHPIDKDDKGVLRQGMSR